MQRISFRTGIINSNLNLSTHEKTKRDLDLHDHSNLKTLAMFYLQLLPKIQRPACVGEVMILNGCLSLGVNPAIIVQNVTCLRLKAAWTVSSDM